MFGKGFFLIYRVVLFSGYSVSIAFEFVNKLIDVLLMLGVRAYSSFDCSIVNGTLAPITSIRLLSWWAFSLWIKGFSDESTFDSSSSCSSP